LPEEWLVIAMSWAMWLIGFITMGNALIQSILFLRVARRAGAKLGLKPEVLRRALHAAFITSFGPCLGIFVGMVPLVIALGGAVAFIRESAGVGSIMFELIAARSGAEAAGVPLTREGMTLLGLATILWTMAAGSVEWVIIGGVFTRWLPALRDKMGGGDPELISLISVAIMLGAFSRLFTTDNIMPAIRLARFAPLTAGITGLVVAVSWIKLADRLRKPWLKEYFMLLAIVLGMAVAQLLFGG